MESWKQVLSGATASQKISAIYDAIRVIRNSAGTSVDNSTPQAIVASDASTKAETELSGRLVKALESDNGIPLQAWKPEQADRCILELSRYAETNANMNTEATKRASAILKEVTFTTNITGSTIGAVAVGDHATVTGTVHVGATRSVTQTRHEEHIKKAKKALIEDEDRLDKLLYEVLWQFLILARKIQVEQQSLAETQAKMKATLDEVWAAQVAKGMRPEVLPKTLEVVKALMENPVMGEVVKGLAGG